LKAQLDATQEKKPQAKGKQGQSESKTSKKDNVKDTKSTQAKADKK
jgi:hypothetical protein